MRRSKKKGPPPEPERRTEVLEEALALVSERGIAGASLRELARRVGLSQPSLYHYFESKDDLVDQLVEMGARHMVDTMRLETFPTIELPELPYVVKDRILELWDGQKHASYSRFLFVVAIESPRHRPLIRRVFEQRLLDAPSEDLAAIFRHSPVIAERLVGGLTMLARALGLALIEDRILFGLAEPSERTLKYADFAAEAIALLLRDAMKDSKKSRKK